MKIKYYYGILTVLLLSALILSASTSLTKNEDASGSKIKFSHKLHSELTDCKSCHSPISDAKSLTDRLLPLKEDCKTCHDVEDTDACNTCHYEDVYEPLPIKTSELLFNHKLHLTINLECTDCHRGITDFDNISEAKHKNPPMESCYTCHNDKSVASNACESCHISTVNLTPQTHKVVDFKKSHKILANTKDANCMMCHDNNSCESCHVGTTMLKTGVGFELNLPYSPTGFVDGQTQQQITRVHDLNYRFTHGIDLKGKNSECQTCHQVEVFCMDCHNTTSGDISLGGIMPSSHLSPTFVLIGKGSGGGEHARLARRDLERCISCHDTKNADPVCITCHTDVLK
ncbi:MAG: cytochrome c3 family protein [Ignavibacteriaceae bacterium]|nr:cytochrome c3 family protein [Ignavibacteriaceae bacterium]